MFDADKQDTRWTQWSQQKAFWFEPNFRSGQSPNPSQKQPLKNSKHFELAEEINTFASESQRIRQNNIEYAGRSVIRSVPGHRQIMCRFAGYKLVEEVSPLLEDVSTPMNLIVY